MADILVKLPTRSRPERAIATIENFKSMAEGPVRFVVSIDADDHTMNYQGMIDKLQSLGNVRVAVGNSKTKIQACNADLENETFDIIVMASDDMRVKVPAWDGILLRTMMEHFPNFDGALHFNDGHVGNRLATLPIMGYNLYRKFGYVYHPDYISLWCDNEYTVLFQAIGRLPYFDHVVIEHAHPSYGSMPRDLLLNTTESFYAQDHATYNKRLANVGPSSITGFGFPDILLSICICSIRSRKDMFRELLAELNRQINGHPQRQQIEIRAKVDGGQLAVGTKRNILMDQAKGRFIVYIDDDDWVEPDYVSEIVKVINVAPEVDCIGMTGFITTDGGNQRPWVISIESGCYHERGATYYRTPNHISPVRHDHARACRFPDVNCGEDYEYARRLMASGRLTREAKTSKPLYHYRYSPSRSSTQHR